MEELKEWINGYTKRGYNISEYDLKEKINELLTKDREQREELVKEAFRRGLNLCKCGADDCPDRLIQTPNKYYNEVIKPKYLNK